MPGGAGRSGRAVPRRRVETPGARDLPAVLADPDDETWQSVAASKAWLRVNGVTLTGVSTALLSAGPATRMRVAMTAWRHHNGFTGPWPFKNSGLVQRSFLERLNQPLK